MCGIIGYIDEKEAIPILIEGLKKLEYRGYDSAGIGILGNFSKIGNGRMMVFNPEYQSFYTYLDSLNYGHRKRGI
jgi:glutamine phosphoribosylpyrophosphate amidotransferase